MDLIESENLPPELRLALAYTPAQFRVRLCAAFALDRRLGQIVAQASEPMLGQLRLAWWRDQLALAASDRPKGDAVLGTISEVWAHTPPLIALVNGWEHLLGEGALAQDDVERFVAGRVAALKGACGIDGQSDAHGPGALWALADAAARTSADSERALLLQFGKRVQKSQSHTPPAMRGVAVLDALAARALHRGGQPLMEGRGAALAAIAAGVRAAFTRN